MNSIEKQIKDDVFLPLSNSTSEFLLQAKSSVEEGWWWCLVQSTTNSSLYSIYSIVNNVRDVVQTYEFD